MSEGNSTVSTQVDTSAAPTTTVESVLGRRTAYQLALSVMGVAALGISQPILDLLGRTPDFFIARASEPFDVVLVGVAVGLVLPTVLALVVLGLLAIGRLVGVVGHMVILAGVASALALSVLRQTVLDEQPWGPAVALAVAFGAGATWAFYRFDGVANVLTVVGFAPLLVTAYFMFLSPSSEVIWGSEDEGSATTAAVSDPAPVVMVLFDEFSLASMIDTEGDIRADQFPSLARLSDDATWFRNAMGTHQGTRDAIPSILTGISQVSGEKLPHYADHPASVFTLLSRDYQVDAIETLTQLCPEAVCVAGSRESVGLGERLSSLWSDLSIITGHVILPTGLTEGLPPIDENWGDFAPPEVVRPENWSIRKRLEEQVEDDRRALVDEFVAQLEQPLADDDFYFIHLPLPHRPWSILSDGRAYPVNQRMPGAAGGGMGPNVFLAEQAYQRQLLQAQYADLIVGSVVESLEASGSYDATLLIIASDHGIAIRPDQSFRTIEPETVGDLAAVPLFIKLPNQESGSVDDYRALTVDIVPTLAGALGAEIPWSTDGIDLFAPTRPQRLESTMSGPDREVVIGISGEEKLEIAQYHEAFFGDRGPFGLAPVGFADLLGAPVPGDVETDGSVSVDLDFPELFTDVDPDADLIPVLLSAKVEGPVDEGAVVAVAVDSEIRVLTEVWQEDGNLHVSALIPPDALEWGANQFDFYIVESVGSGFEFTFVGSA